MLCGKQKGMAISSLLHGKTKERGDFLLSKVRWRTITKCLYLWYSQMKIKNGELDWYWWNVYCGWLFKHFNHIEFHMTLGHITFFAATLRSPKWDALSWIVCAQDIS